MYTPTTYADICTHLCESTDEYKLPLSRRYGCLLELLETSDSVTSQHSHHARHVAGVGLLHVNRQLLYQDVTLNLKTNPVLKITHKRDRLMQQDQRKNH